jgi:hypothetical protein
MRYWPTFEAFIRIEHGRRWRSLTASRPLSFAGVADVGRRQNLCSEAEPKAVKATVPLLDAPQADPPTGVLPWSGVGMGGARRAEQYVP